MTADGVVALGVLIAGVATSILGAALLGFLVGRLYELRLEPAPAPQTIRRGENVVDLSQERVRRRGA
jgi:hypothetical protein